MADPKWVTVARSYVGLKELKGTQHNKIILGWLGRLKAWWAEDETPWCGTFVAACLVETGLPKAKAWYRALAWADYGVPVKPTLGAVLVFHRSGGGHVGFYMGESNTNFYVLGGNQGDSVSYSWIAKNRLAASRWPSEVPVPTTGKVKLAGDGKPVSTNEA